MGNWHFLGHLEAHWQSFSEHALQAVVKI